MDILSTVTYTSSLRIQDVWRPFPGNLQNKFDSLGAWGFGAQQQMPYQPGKQPLELLITILSFLPALHHIAVCACVSRHWRRAAARAVPKTVVIDARYSTDLLPLLTKSCNLGAVESVLVLYVKEAGFKALFARICAEAPCLREVTMPAEYFHTLALVPATLTKLTLKNHQRGFRLPGNGDLTSLARLTQLKELSINSFLNSPLPQLPALTYFVGHFYSDLQLQALSNVSATLKYLQVHAHELDFRRPISLARFSRLHTLKVSVDCIRNLCPEVLPPTLQYIEVQSDVAIDENLVFPVGKAVVYKAKRRSNESYVIKWTCPV